MMDVEMLDPLGEIHTTGGYTQLDFIYNGNECALFIDMA
ncbi:hypothetical protein L917_02085 [Phytophthora nicotianae]|uniref:Uncharacterized protein n=1 Tax=Phytophthora nicotianae TaxID=4792 RepID=W2HJZ5_PHYNI|nr:hypothetical protein L915_02197 [Phytophthora nicotianae]ETM01309.1 hypothetical protein L917_02085 [Phytophthora nicotianae]ETM54493.1 hypothetical protein L914_02177 [Phytophthora nicotianae]